MRKLTVVFLVLIALLQYPLWLGKGSWLRVWQYSQQIVAHEKRNDYYRQRNETLREEVRDLKQGQSAVEERARSELGLVKQDEVFFQVMQNKPKPGSKAASASASVNPNANGLAEDFTPQPSAAATAPPNVPDTVSHGQ